MSWVSTCTDSASGMQKVTPTKGSQIPSPCLPPGPPKSRVGLQQHPHPDCQPVPSSRHPLGHLQTSYYCHATQRWRLGLGERRTRRLKSQAEANSQESFPSCLTSHLCAVFSGTTSHKLLEAPRKKLRIVKGEGWAGLGCLPHPTASCLGDAGPSASQRLHPHRWVSVQGPDR